MPAAAAKRGIKFRASGMFWITQVANFVNLLGKFASFCRYVSWNYLWSGREYGLLFNDQYFEPAPEVKEALRRLNLQEPHEFDARKIRLTNAHNLAMKNERLPKNQWTKWDEVSRNLLVCREYFYLGNLLSETLFGRNRSREARAFKHLWTRSRLSSQG